MSLSEDVEREIKGHIGKSRVVLFMKGTRHFPQCGFSATVTQILDELVPEYHTVNVLKAPEIRSGIKTFSNWPTIPQLYVEGEFVGGCDIIREMYLEGELQKLLGVEDDSKEPSITVTDSAREALEKARAQGGEGTLRLGVSTRFEYELALDEPQKGDYAVDAGGLTVLVDRMSAKRADGITIDYTPDGGGGFRIDNPNEPPRVKQLSVTELARMLEAGEKLELIDVRPEDEARKASIEGGTLLEDAAGKLEGLEKDTPLVFYCHHGIRSQSAAERYLAQGFRKVYNLAGGIEAWSKEVDPNVPRY
ncbi:MAG: Grx4 family monothiol glutaredoxin [Myxococcales bacterium]|jgi:monothiol glutaredoxin